MKKTTAEATICELRQLFSCYCLPEQVVSDNGPQFVSEEFKAFLKVMGSSISVVPHTILHQLVWWNVLCKCLRKQCEHKN